MGTINVLVLILFKMGQLLLTNELQVDDKSSKIQTICLELEKKLILGLYNSHV